MPAAIRYPREIRVGSAVVKIYRVPHPKSGYLFQVVWRAAGGKRMKPQFADPEEAEKEARLQASKLASGRVEVDGMTAHDRDELLAVRRACSGTPILTAIREWVEAHEITGGRVLVAARAFAAANGAGFTPILAPTCVEKFIAAKNAAGTDGDRVYASKLKPIKTAFAGRELHSISTAEWQAYLRQWTDGVTHNDFRKRALSMCLWAQKQGYLPRGVELELAQTEKMAENSPEVGLILPATFGRLLWHLHQNHPIYLAALVLAGFCGIRSDEIHGKRKDGREKRQLWADVHLHDPEPLVTLTNAKENTPAWRTVPLTEAAVEWLELCPSHEGPVSEQGAMEHVRKIGIAAGLHLPENCFRHSYVSFQVALTGNKSQVATWAGNSVALIDKHYRRPVFAETGEHVDIGRLRPITKKIAAEWFAMTPARAAELPLLRG
jgi:integrase